MPIDYYGNQNQDKNFEHHTDAKKEKMLEDTYSQNSSDQIDENRGVFYPNPIEDMEDAKIPRKMYRNKFGVNYDSLIMFIIFVCAFCFYVVIRIKFSLALGNYVPYGWIMLILEISGGVSVLQFSFSGSLLVNIYLGKEFKFLIFVNL